MSEFNVDYERIDKVSVAETYQEFIYKRTYSRFLPDEGRRERWQETVVRYFRFFADRIMAIDHDLFKEFLAAIKLVENKQVMPSMRALWTAGPALERENIAGYNCAYTVIDSPKAFAEVLYILMNGTGVGFSVERQYVSKLPEVPTALLPSEKCPTIIVEDSKLGWAEAFHMLLEGLYGGIICPVDYSLIRPKGSMLKTFGGRASGPEPLKQLVDFTIKTFKNAQGRKLNSLEVYDIVCMIANTVVVGGVRRSATLSLSNLSDTRMRDAKQGEFWLAHPQRTLSNNSVAYTEKPDASRFMEEWLALMKSGTGERGIINREAMKKACKAIGRDSEYDFGVNPCLIGSTRLLTPDGYKPIKDLVGESLIINKDGNVVKSKVWCSGEKKTVKLKLSTRKQIQCTPDHRFMTVEGEIVEAKDLKGKQLMPYLKKPDNDPFYIKLGFIQGDGCTGRLANNDRLGLEINLGKKDQEVKELFGVPDMEGRIVYYTGLNQTLKDLGFSSNKLPERPLPETFSSWTLKEKASFLQGLYSANGSVESTSGRVQLTTSCKELAYQVRNILALDFGIKAYITSTKPRVIEFPNGAYDCKQSYDVNIGNYEGRLLFYNNIGFVQEYKTKLLEDYLIRKAPRVSFVESARVAKVYDFTEPETHWGVAEGFIVHNCGEVVLRPKQFCNLTEVVVRPEDNFIDLKEKVKAATILGVLQSTLTNFTFLDEEWKKNVEEERLLGVSLTGLADHPILSKNSPGAEGWLEALRETAHNTAKEWADALGINIPKAITTVKPSGTVSQLVDASSGLHPRYSPYYIRRVRVNTSDPICKLLMAKNVPCHPEVGQTWEDCNTVVFEFPMKSPEGSVCRKDVSAIEQLEYWKMLKTHWTDHNPDVTIYVKDDEWLEVGAWVFKNWDLIAGISFLPYDGGVYQLAPYEEITKEQYDELVKHFPKDIDLEELSKYEKQDQTQGSREYACVAGACEI